VDYKTCGGGGWTRRDCTHRISSLVAKFKSQIAQAALSQQKTMDFLVRLAERRGRLGSPPLHRRSTAKGKIAPQTVLKYPATAVVGVVFGVAAGVVIVVNVTIARSCHFHARQQTLH
jgi:hypothetical protein